MLPRKISSISAKRLYMATKDIIVRLKMLATGTKEQVADSEQIASNYSRAEKSAQKLGAPSARAAAYAGSRSPRETVEYGMARGAAGATGASARDFANQAQGLGGLVRLYATYAANVFAVSAAFRALSDAMNTTNMIRGLDQLGAASGRALGNLSKQLVDVTDGAISLRDAMDSVAKTTSSGMSSANVLRLGVAAQKASQALGLSMGDALSRLTRGITKLEPELLDELGIFIRIDDAAEKYARTIGKTASSLTDFERRQGFALAVLDQVESKFGKLNLVTNPYDKLAASAANLTQKLLELINVGLAPIANFLSQSPAALGAAIIGIGTLILKQALPILTMYREGLKKSREASLAAVAGTSSDFMAGVVKAKSIALKEAEKLEDEKIKLADEAEARLQALREKNAVNSNKRVREILRKASADVTTQDINYLNAMAAASASKGNLKSEQEYKNISTALTNAKDATLSRMQASKDFADAEAAFNKQSIKDLEKDREFRKQITQAARDDLAVITAQKTKQQGLFSALKQGFSDVIAQRKQLSVGVPILDEKTGKATGAVTQTIVKGLNKTEAAMGMLRVATTGVSQAVVGLLGRLGTLSVYAAAGVAVFELLNNILSTSKKESEAYAKSTELVTGALKNVSATLEAVRNKKPEDILSAESVQARANAFNDLSDAVLKVSKDFDKLIKAQGPWERFADRIARFFSIDVGNFANNFGGVTNILLTGISKISTSLFGKGQKAEFADNLAESIAGGLALAETDIERQQLGGLLQKILGSQADLDNIENLKKQLDSLPMSELSAKGTEVAEALKKVSNEANNSASRFTQVKENIKAAAKAIDDLNNSLVPTDKLGKIGVEFLNTGSALHKALGDTKNAIVGISDALNSPQLMSLFPPELSASLLKDKQYIEEVKTQLGEARERAREYKTELAKLPGAGKGNEEQEIARRSLTENLARQQNFITMLEEKSVKIAQKYSTTITNAVFEAGAQKLEAALKFGFERAAITAAKGFLSALSAAGGETAKREGQLALQELDIQARVIEAQYQSKLATERNTLAIEKNTIQQQVTELNKKIAAAGGAGNINQAGLDETVRLNTELQKIAVKEKLLETEKLGIKDLNNIRKNGNEVEKAAIAEMSGLVAVMYGKQIALAEIAGAKEAQRYQNIVKLEKEKAETENKGLTRQEERNSKRLSEITTAQDILGIYDSTLAIEKNKLEISNQEIAAKKQIRLIDADIAILNQLKGKTGDDEKKRLEAIARAQEARKNAEDKSAADRKNSTDKFAVDSIRQQEALATKERDHAANLLNLNTQITTSKLDLEEQYLQLLDQAGAKDKVALIQEQTRIQLTRLDLDLQTQLFDLQNKQLDLEGKKRARDEAERRGVKSDELNSQLDREQQALNRQRDAILASNDARRAGIELSKEQNIQLERQNYILNQAAGMAGILNDNFGKTGQRLSSAVSGFAEVQKSINATFKAQDAFNRKAEQMGEDSTAEQWKEFWEERDALEKKGAQDELERNAMALSSTKKLFKEKTAAYKAIGAIEKVYHVVRLAMMAKEVAATIANTLTYVTSSVTRQGAAVVEAGVLGVKAVVNAISSLPFPLNLAAGAATTAVVAKLLASIGKAFKGGGGGGGFTPTTQQSQEVQGTALSYDENGKKVQTSRGVFGDTSAKSDSIAKGIERISATSVDGLEYQDKILTTLRSIDNSIGGAAKSLYGLTSLRVGMGAGFTLPGTRVNENWVGIDTKKISTDVTEAGLVIKGSLNDLLTNTQNAVYTYQAGIRKIDFPSWRFWSTDYQEAYKEMKKMGQSGGPSADLVEYIRIIFSNAKTGVVSLAGELGKDAAQVAARLATVQFDQSINIKDLSGADLEKEVQSVISSMLDKTAEAVFAEYEQFAQFNEGLLETVIRVYDTNKKIRQSLDNLGLDTSKLFGFAGQVLTEGLAKANGGLEGFLNKVEDFRKAFYTETEQITPIYKGLVKDLSDGTRGLASSLGLTKAQFEALGLGAINSSYEFRAFIESIDPVDEASTQLLNTMLDLAPAFDKVYNTVDKLLRDLNEDTIKLSSSLDSLGIAIRDILLEAGPNAELIKGVNADLKVLVTNVKTKLMDALKTSFKTAYEDRKRELTSSLDAIKKVKESLLDLRNSLLIGELSPLDPLEQYNQLFGQYQQTLIDVQSTDSALSDAAKQAFPNLAKQVLESARSLYASSGQYQQIFDQVLADTDQLGLNLTTQEDIQQESLDALEKQYTEITGINSNTATAATRLAEIYTEFQRLQGLDPDTLATAISTALGGGKTGVEALAQAFGLTDPGSFAKAAGLEAIAIEFARTAKAIVESAITEMKTLSTNTLAAMRDANKTVVDSVGEVAEDVLTKVGDTVVGSKTVGGGGSVAGGGSTVAASNAAIIVTASDAIQSGSLDSSFAADEYGEGGDLITLNRVSSQTVGGEDLTKNPKTGSTFDDFEEGEALTGVVDRILDGTGSLGDEIDNLNDVLSGLGDAGDTVISIVSDLDSFADGAVTLNSSVSDLSNITDAATAVIDTFSSSITDGLTLVAYAYQDLTELRNNTIIGAVPALADAVIGTVSSGIDLVTSGLEFAAGEIGRAISDAVDFSSSPWVAGGLSGFDIGGGGPGTDAWLPNQVLAYANGGSVNANMPYMVGERGPELFVPSTNGSIIPNNELRNNQQLNQEIVQKLDQLIEAVVVSNHSNAQMITTTLEDVKSRKSWENGQVYGRVTEK